MYVKQQNCPIWTLLKSHRFMGDLSVMRFLVRPDYGVIVFRKWAHNALTVSGERYSEHATGFLWVSNRRYGLRWTVISTGWFHISQN